MLHLPGSLLVNLTEVLRPHIDSKNLQAARTSVAPRGSCYRAWQADQASIETSLEVFYQAQVTGWMRVVLDLQYIESPGGLSSTSDALVSTIRTIVNY